MAKSQDLETLSSSDQTRFRAAIGVDPIISGTPAYGETLTSTIAGQWYADGSAISGETGSTLIVPTTLPVGTVITQRSSNSTKIMDALDAFSWVLRLQAQRGPETATPFVATGSSISSWLDQYGTSGRTATASTAPTLQVNNGNRVARFTGSQKLTIPSTTLTGDITLTVAFQPSSTASASRNLVEGGSASTYIQIQSSTGLRVKPSGTTSFTDLTFPRALTTGRWHILTLVVSNGVATVYVNGQAGSTASVAASTWTIQNFGEGFMGDIGAILLTNSALSSEQRQQVRNALSQYQTNRFYVSNAGSDTNNGFTLANAFASIGKAISAGLYPGDTVYLQSGGVWREDVRPVSPWAAGVGNKKITFTTTGSEKATVLGSFQVATAWTLVTGTEYSTPLAATPRNAFWINGSTIDETTVNKLVLGTAGSLTTGQYGYSGGTLRINIGKDPSSERIEVPRDGNAADSHIFYLPGYNCYRVENLNFYFAYVDGFFSYGKETQLVNSNCSWNGEDGCGASSTGNLDVFNSRFVANGGERTTAGGRGDGISFHDFATGQIIGNYVYDNRKGGITNLSGCTVTVARNYIKGNNLNLYVLAVTGQSGIHTIHSNIIVMRTDDQKIGINRDGVNNPAIIHAYNNTIYNAYSSGVGINQPDEAKGNIIQGFPTGITGLTGNATVADHNCIYGATSAAYSGVTPGDGSITANPLFLDLASEDFRIARGSPCYGSGPVTTPALPNYDGLYLSQPNIGAK